MDLLVQSGTDYHDIDRVQTAMVSSKQASVIKLETRDISS
jgi:hypothetical protein